jgi:hypothetical protein
MASKDKGFSQLLLRVKKGLSKIYQHQYAPITTDNSPVPTKDEKKPAA